MTSNDPLGWGWCWFTFAMKCIFVDKPQTFRIWKLGRKSSGQISGKINQWERKQRLRTNRNGDFVIFPGTSWRDIGGLHISIKVPPVSLPPPHKRRRRKKWFLSHKSIVSRQNKSSTPNHTPKEAIYFLLFFTPNCKKATLQLSCLTPARIRVLTADTLTDADG